MKPILEYLQELKAALQKQLDQVEKHIALETETTQDTSATDTTDNSGDRPPTSPPVG